jgi:hypothetical protein
VRSQIWRAKTKWFAAAAAVAVAGSAMMLYRPVSDRGAMSPVAESPEVSQVMALGTRLQNDYQKISSESNVGYATENFRRLVDYRSVWPSLIYDSARAVASTEPQPDLLSGDLEKIKRIAPKERRLVRLVDLGGVYSYDAQQKSRRIAVQMDVELSHQRPIEFLNNTIAAWLRENAERPGVPYRIVEGSVSCNPGEMQTLRWTEAGEESVSGGGGTRTPQRGSGFGGSTRTPPQPPPAPPQQGGGTRGPTGGFGAGGGDVPGRRDKGRGKRSAPGKGGGSGFGGGPSGGAAPGGGASQPPTRGGGFGGTSRPRQTGGQPSRGTATHANLDAMAPVPDRPSIYPAGVEFYRVPITFEIELLDSAAMRKAAETAARDASGEESKS